MLTAASPPSNQPENLDCADTVRAIVVPAELVKLLTAVAAYNGVISALAAANGWAYVDPNPGLDSLRAIPTQVAPFPAFTDAQDHTCGNWTSNTAGSGSAQLGHHDRTGGGNVSWNSTHPSRGCSQENLVATGGAGLFYCFAIN